MPDCIWDIFRDIPICIIGLYNSRRHTSGCSSCGKVLLQMGYFISLIRSDNIPWITHRLYTQIKYSSTGSGKRKQVYKKIIFLILMSKIGIIGAGGWGIALSILLTNNNHTVRLWEFLPDVAQKLEKERVSEELLPGITIPSSIRITSSLKEAVNNAYVLVIAVPSHVVRSVAQQLRSFDLKDKLIVSGVKGIEVDSLLRISQILQEEISELNSDQIIALSGPSHAEEVARGIPTAVTAASKNLNQAQRIQNVFMCPVFRIYTSQDIIGVELSGALKNVIAIASGICDGAKLGDNTKAALLTRGIAEMTRLGVAMGADAKTFSGLAGIGDLIVTCMSKYSRNRYVGEQIGKGYKLKEILQKMVMIAEGVKTTESAYKLSKKYGIETPIMQKVYDILFNNIDPRSAVFELMTRAAKAEH